MISRPAPAHLYGTVADEDERDFIIHMAEKSFILCALDPNSDPDR